MKSVVILLLFVGSLGRAQSQLDTYNFQFKGYVVSITDEISDAEGNHIFVGNAKVTQPYAQDRDARLDALYKLGDYSNDPDNKGILLITDAHYHLLKLDGLPGSFARILWDAAQNCYWIGGSSPYFQKGFGYQVVLTKLNAQKEIIGHTAVETEGNTYLQDMVLKENTLVMLTMTTKGDIGETEYIPSLLEISTTKEQDSKGFTVPIKVPTIIYQTTLPYPKMYRFDFSPLFVRDGSVCFGLGHAVDKHYGIRFFRYSEGKVEAINETQNIDAYHGPFLIGLLPTYKDGYLLAYANYFTKKLTLARTDRFLQPLTKQQTQLAAFTDFNRFLELPDGRLVLLTVSKNRYWSYELFDAEGKFLKEVETSLRNTVRPTFFKLTYGSTLLASFYLPGKDDPVALQTLRVD